MGFIAKDSGGGDYTPAPVGTFPAVCVQIIDIGTQHSEYYKTSKHKILLGWELCGDERQDNGEPFLIWKRYTMSLHENATLRAHLQAWRGKAFDETELAGFDVSKILGVPCLVNVAHQESNGKTYANVEAVMAMPKGSAKPKATSSLLTFDIENPDMDVFATFREKLQETIKRSAEWQAREGGGDGSSSSAGFEEAANEPLDIDDIPF